MSDDWITVIPRDPHHLPNAAQQAQAKDLLSEIAPEADEIEIITHDSVRFFDCGSNFGYIRCPTCHTELTPEWWSSRMSDDYAGGFELNAYPMPCCHEHHTLADLIYEWEQGFSRFALSAQNPRIGKLKAEQHKELELRLGTTLRVIYQHL